MGQQKTGYFSLCPRETPGCPATVRRRIRTISRVLGPAWMPVDFFRVGRKVRTGLDIDAAGPPFRPQFAAGPQLRCFAAGRFLGRRAYSFFDADVPRRCATWPPECTRCHRCVALARVPRSRRAISGRRFVTRACAPWQGVWLPRKRGPRSCAKARRFLEWPCDAACLHRL